MEDHETRLRRLRLRSWRRGMKEMDLILGPFADTELAGLTQTQLNDYEAMMEENDQDLYLWVTSRARGQHDGPTEISAILDVISASAFGRFSENSAHFSDQPAKTSGD